MMAEVEECDDNGGGGGGGGGRNDKNIQRVPATYTNVT
jgi:hypothetical protein